jgi:hypothetical protein
MKIFDKPIFKSQPLALLVFILILNGLYINSQLETQFKPIRYGLVIIFQIVVLLCLAQILKSLRVQKKTFIFLFSHLLILGHGLLLASINGGISLIDERSFLFLILSVYITLYMGSEINGMKSFTGTPPPEFFAI